MTTPSLWLAMVFQVVPLLLLLLKVQVNGFLSQTWLAVVPSWEQVRMGS